MPNYSKRSAPPEIEFEDLDWSKLPYYLELDGDRNYETVPKLDLEYSDEEGLTPDEYVAKVSAWNNAQISKRMADNKEITKERNGFLSAFKRVSVMPQLLATIGVLPLVIKDGIVKPKETILNWVELSKHNKIVHSKGKPISSAELKGMIKFLTFRVRGNIVNGTQTKETAYNGAVPLVLRAFKTYQNIQYSQYDYHADDIELFVDPNSLDFMRLDSSVFDKGVLKEIHNKYVNMEYKLMSPSIVKEPIFAEYELSVPLCSALAQIWIYSPNLYHTYALHNFLDFDKPAEPLVPEELFAPKPKSLMPTRLSQKAKFNITKEEDFPW
jgi:hypothetical protein